MSAEGLNLPWGNFQDFGTAMARAGYDVSRDCVVLEKGDNNRPTRWGMKSPGPHLRIKSSFNDQDLKPGGKSFDNAEVLVTIKSFTTNSVSVGAAIYEKTGNKCGLVDSAPRATDNGFWNHEVERLQK